MKSWQSIWDVNVPAIFEEIESEWTGGIADFGDPRAAEAIVNVPGYAKYRQAIVRAAGKLPLVRFAGLRGLLMYRSMDADDAEYLESGGSIGPKGYTFRRQVAEAWRRFAGHRGRRDLVVASGIVLLKGIIMRGKREEAELVVDTGWVQGTRILGKR